MTGNGKKKHATLSKVLLIGGLPRGGTTAIVDIINECPDAAIMAEYRLIDLVTHLEPILSYEAEIRQLEGQLWSSTETSPEISDDGLMAFDDEFDDEFGNSDVSDSDATECDEALHYPGFVTPGLQQTLRFPTKRRFPIIVSEVVKSSLNKPAARIIGSKLPGTMLADGGEYLAKLFPEVRYLAMLRAPLAQINSSMNRRNRAVAGIDAWSIEDIQQAIDTYIENIVGLFVLRNRAKHTLLFVKYEEMVENYDAVVDRLFSHLGTDWRPAHKFTVSERGTIDVLTVHERERIEQVLGRLIAGWDTAKLTGASDADLSIFHNILPALPDQSYSLEGVRKPGFLASGWSDMEPDGIWTDADKATLIFGPVKSPKMMLKIEFIAFLASGKPLEIDMMMNETDLGKIVLLPGTNPSWNGPGKILSIPDWTQKNELLIGPLDFKSDDANLLEFTLTGICSPTSLGKHLDDRDLGIRLSKLEFVPADQALH